MSGDDICFCGSMRRHKKCHSDISANSLAAKMLSLYSYADERISGYYFEHKKRPVCKKGCCECCSTVFNVSIIEYFLICRELIRWEPKKVLQVKQKVIKGITYLSNEHPDFFSYLRSDHGGLEFKDLLYKNYDLSKEINLECPLLTELSGKEKICPVYRVRPLLCRIAGTSYFSTNDNLNICSNIGGNKKLMEMAPSTVDIWSFFIEELLTHKYEKGSFMGTVYPIIYWFFLSINQLDDLKTYLSGERYEKYFVMNYKKAKEIILSAPKIQRQHHTSISRPS